MNISGVLVHAHPRQMDSVKHRLGEFDGVEVHGDNEAGKIVVTIEARSDAEMSQTVLEMQDLPGVLNASMIYHQFENE